MTHDDTVESAMIMRAEAVYNTFFEIVMELHMKSTEPEDDRNNV